MPEQTNKGGTKFAGPPIYHKNCQGLNTLSKNTQNQKPNDFTQQVKIMTIMFSQTNSRLAKITLIAIKWHVFFKRPCSGESQHINTKNSINLSTTDRKA